jgi:hypothetical protein
MELPVRIQECTACKAEKTNNPKRIKLTLDETIKKCERCNDLFCERHAKKDTLTCAGCKAFRCAECSLERYGYIVCNICALYYCDKCTVPEGVFVKMTALGRAFILDMYWGKQEQNVLDECEKYKCVDCIEKSTVPFSRSGPAVLTLEQKQSNDMMDIPLSDDDDDDDDE